MTFMQMISKDRLKGYNKQADVYARTFVLTWYIRAKAQTGWKASVHKLNRIGRLRSGLDRSIDLVPQGYTDTW